VVVDVVEVVVDVVEVVISVDVVAKDSAAVVLVDILVLVEVDVVDALVEIVLVEFGISFNMVDVVEEEKVSVLDSAVDASCSVDVSMVVV
jgi:hypothetical protein